jgi:hypothetical protein
MDKHKFPCRPFQYYTGGTHSFKTAFCTVKENLLDENKYKQRIIWQYIINCGNTEK